MELNAETNKSVIVFKVVYSGAEEIVETYRGEYRNLMVLLTDKFYPESFGECRGMGRCCTCVVEIQSPGNRLAGMARNEAVTLGKAGISQVNMRLACQVGIDEALENALVMLKDPG